MQWCLNTPGTTLYRKNYMQCCPRGSRQHCTRKHLVHPMSSEKHLVTFRQYFSSGITGCCKCRANTVQILTTLHKKNPRPTLNKNARAYGGSEFSSCKIKLRSRVTQNDVTIPVAYLKIFM